MSEQRVEIDLNDVDAEGLTTVLIEDAPGLAVGDLVIAFESEDGVQAPAEVVRVNATYAAIRVAWTQMTRITPTALTTKEVVVDRVLASAQSRIIIPFGLAGLTPQLVP
ncbi:MAG: hypothetical protein HY996_03835 [Micrococcales bacterium]|nr:hypothetical protein [Micrococcales bacterium]